MSQSPLIGAFVPGDCFPTVESITVVVSIPSDRGIRSGKGNGCYEACEYIVSIPSDRGIRSGFFIKDEDWHWYGVSIPSDRGIRSGLLTTGTFRLIRNVSIPSDRGIRSGRLLDRARTMAAVLSQSPLIGAFVPGCATCEHIWRAAKSQSPLIGAFVPGENIKVNVRSIESVSIPSDRGIRSGCTVCGKEIER